MTKRFRKKAIEVEAIQWTGENAAEIGELTEPDVPRMEMPSRTLYFGGDSWAVVGNWIVRDPDGAIRIVSSSLFEATYEPANQDRYTVDRVTEDWDATNCVRLCDRCEEEMGAGVADKGDRACSSCGADTAPHIYPALRVTEGGGLEGVDRWRWTPEGLHPDTEPDRPGALVKADDLKAAPTQPCPNCDEGVVGGVEPDCCGNTTSSGECRGDCAVPKPVEEQCPTCGGSGEVPTQQPALDLEGLRKRLYEELTLHMEDRILCRVLAELFDPLSDSKEKGT